jgi:NAD-dependent dihydropyrimidine dehydrogenase PreA subunit
MVQAARQEVEGGETARRRLGDLRIPLLEERLGIDENPRAIVSRGVNPQLKLVVREDRCSGCRTCELACSMRNFSQPNPKRSAVRVSGAFPAPGKYSLVYCDQCGVCAEMCPADAIREVGDHYEIDSDLCTGCLICVDECPQDAIFVDPFGEKPIKCVSCGDCIEYCPRQAIIDQHGEVAWAGVEARKKAQTPGR